MNAERERPAVYEFGDLRVDRTAFKVWKGGEEVHLEPKAFDLLLYLIEHRGRVVDRRELLDAIWKDTSVTEGALTREIAHLRKVLNDDSKDAKYVETLPRRGYRFVATEGAPATGTAPSPRRRHALAAGLTALGVLLILMVWWAASDRESPALAEPTPRQITAGAGLDGWPSFSPDGNEIAYSSDRTGAFEIWIRQVSPGGREVQLTTDGGQNVQPAWSPDGTQIAYCSAKKSGIWLVPSRGGTSRQLADFGSSPAWSPDGRTVAFQSDGLADFGTAGYPAYAPSTIRAVSAGSGEIRSVTRPNEPPGGHGLPSWSSDGKRIAFVSYDVGTSQIWSVPLDGGAAKPITDAGVSMYDPVFSPEGNAIYYAALGPQGIGRITRKNLASSGERVEVVTGGPAALRHVAVSRDGRRLAYSAIVHQSNLWSAPVSPDTALPAGAPVMLTHDTSHRNTAPDFSPDGSKIAFVVWRLGAAPGVWIANADGSGAEQLVISPKPQFLPRWQADGRQISYMVREKDQWRLALTDVATRRESMLPDIAPEAAVLELSPDGRSVVFHAGKSGVVNVWTGDLRSGQTRQRTFSDTLMGFPHWSGDGSFITFEIKEGSDTHVGVLPSSGAKVEGLTSGREQAWPYRVSPDNDKIAYAGMRDGLWNIWWVSRADGRQQQVTFQDRPGAFVRFPAWSPQGDRIVYEHAELKGNIWMIDLPEAR